MTLTEFIFWCKLKDVLIDEETIDADWDKDAQHYKASLDNGVYKATMVYAVLHDQAVLVSSTLYKRSDLGMEVMSQPDVKTIISKFFEGEE